MSVESTPTPIRVLALGPNQHTHYAPLHNQAALEIIETGDYDPAKLHDLSPDVVLTVTPDYFMSTNCVREAQQLCIPTLLLFDGILEWRNQWTNPKMGAGGGAPHAQPAPTDKIACFGWQNARTLETWGNIGKCEIVGTPRFDHYITSPVQRIPHAGARRLLIMTANTPAFTPEQAELVKQSLADVKAYMAQQSNWEPVWRVRGGLDAELGLADNLPDLRGKPLKEAFAHIDAVLTTPSTVLLESMLARLPTAVLDYTNSPNYVAAGWSITAPSQVAPILGDLLEPNARRLLFQDEVLHNQLECRTPATDRLIQLIRAMADIGRAARAQGVSLQFPTRILPVTLGGHTLPPDDFDLAALYPDNPVFRQKQLQALQIELLDAHKEIKLLRHKLETGRFGYWFRLLAMRVYKTSRKRLRALLS